jgi:hypothetical protein
MALQALHSLYWPGDGIVNAVAVPDDAQYPAWQPVVITACSLLLWMVPTGPLHLAFIVPFTTYGWQLSKRWKQRLTGYWRKLPLRVRLAVRLARVLWSDEWTKACAIVQEVNRTPGMREPNVWGPIGNYMGQQPGVGENVYRHLLAAQKWGPERPYERHTRNLMFELAHYAAKEL